MHKNCGWLHVALQCFFCLFSDWICVQVCMCFSVWGLSDDPGHLRTQRFLKQEAEGNADVSRVWESCSTHSLCWCVLTVTQFIFSISMVLSLHNHISADLKCHTCCSTIYLQAGFIVSNLSPWELCISVHFGVCLCMRVSPCVWVNTYLKSPVFQAWLV